MELNINGKAVTIDADPNMPLLWVLRDTLNMTGTKFGCGVAACGACTVHIDGEAVRSCVMPLAAVEGKNIQTIESLGTVDKPHALQEAWIAEQVPQCGYCQSGMLMAAAALLERKPIVLMPTKQELSTVEAANFLNVSRPFVIKEIEAGRLPHRMVGTHRRVTFDDLQTYAVNMRAHQKSALERMADNARELGLDY